MRFLADESCDFAVVRALRESGYDVVSVSEISPRAEDSSVIDLAVKDKRILLTEDKDFGQLVHAHGQETGGVIFLRFPASDPLFLSQISCFFKERKSDDHRKKARQILHEHLPSLSISYFAKIR